MNFLILQASAVSHYRLLPVETWDSLCCMLLTWEVMPFRSCSTWSSSLWDCLSTQLLWICRETGHAKGVEMNKGRKPNAINFIMISESRVFVSLFSDTDSPKQIFNNAGQGHDCFLKHAIKYFIRSYKKYLLLIISNRPRWKKSLIFKTTSTGNRIHIEKGPANYFVNLF